MCLGGAPKAPSPTPPPAPAPVPIEPQAGVVKPKDQLERMRFGLASTIKTGPRGITGSGANLTSATPTGKTKLGA
jgi:hypothetical protein